MVLGVVGVFVPLAAAVGALRPAALALAPVAYPPGSHRRARAEVRLPAGRRTRWDAVVDLSAVPPARPTPARPPTARG